MAEILTYSVVERMVSKNSSNIIVDSVRFQRTQIAQVRTLDSYYYNELMNIRPEVPIHIHRIRIHGKFETL